MSLNQQSACIGSALLLRWSQRFNFFFFNLTAASQKRGLLFCERMTYVAEYKPTSFCSNFSVLHFTQQPTLVEVVFFSKTKAEQAVNPLKL